MRNALVTMGALAALGAAAVGLAGCSRTDVIRGRVAVVASTDVYGSIVRLIGGDRVDVTSLVDGDDPDPRRYEVSAQDRTAVTDANLVVINGGGYDPFMYPLISMTGVHQIDAAVASGRLPASAHAGDGATDTIPEGFDPAVFADLAGMERLAAAIGDALTALDPGGAATYSANEASFTASVDALVAREQALATAGACGAVLAIDPTPGYLLSAAGCVDVTPPAYRDAVEHGTAAAAPDLQAVLDLIARGGTMPLRADGTPPPVPAFLHPGLVVLRAGSTRSEDAAITASADAAGVPVVAFSDTLPAGDDYLTWMGANLDAIEAAIG